MTAVPINYWAVIVAALIRMVVGTVWYSPIAFVKPWQKLAGLTPEIAQAGLVKAIVVDVVLSLIAAYVLAHFVFYAGARTIADGALTGFWAWLGFVFTSGVALWAYENRPLKLVAINTGHYLVSLLLMGAVLAIWR